MDTQNIEKIRKEFNQWREAYKLSYKKIASQIGNVFSATTLSLFADDKYSGDSSAVARILQKYLRQEKEKIISTASSTEMIYHKTSGMLKLWQLAKYAKHRHRLCVVTGEPGTGKSVAIHQFCEAHSGIIRIECVKTFTPRSMLLHFHEELKLDGSGSVHNLFVEVVQRLKESDMLIILDEAENLKTDCLEIARRIWDLTNCGVLLVGTGRLIRNLRGRTGELKQLYSRVAMSVEISTLRKEDAREIIETNLGDLAADKWEMIFALSKKNARHLANLIEAIKSIAEVNGGKIDNKVITDAAQLLIIQ